MRSGEIFSHLPLPSQPRRLLARPNLGEFALKWQNAWSVHMRSPANLQVLAPKHRTQVVQTGGCQNCSTQAEQLPLPHLASSLETNSIKHFGWNSSHPAIFCLKWSLLLEGWAPGGHWSLKASCEGCLPLYLCFHSTNKHFYQLGLW